MFSNRSGFMISEYITDIPVRILTHLPVNTGDLPNPFLAFKMVHGHDIIVRPVEMIGNEGYLLIDPFRGVASYPPGWTTSMSNVCSHLGQVAVILPDPSSLICW